MRFKWFMEMKENGVVSMMEWWRDDKNTILNLLHIGRERKCAVFSIDLRAELICTLYVPGCTRLSSSFAGKCSDSSPRYRCTASIKLKVLVTKKHRRFFYCCEWTTVVVPCIMYNNRSDVCTYTDYFLSDRWGIRVDVHQILLWRRNANCTSCDRRKSKTRMSRK